MMYENEKTERGHVGYEYREITVPRELSSLCRDSYPCFGWEADPNHEAAAGGGRVPRHSPAAGQRETVTLCFRRNRSIRNKAELTRLQRNFDSCVAELQALERAKTASATIAALVAALTGTAFMAGATFAVVAEPPIIWLTILLDGTVELEMVCSLLCASYELTAGRAKAPKAAVPSGPRSWIVPANYHYFDLEAAFAASDLLNWKQTSSVAAGDIVYLYVGAPVSAVRYRCQVLEAGIPYDYDDGKVRMRRVMKLKRLFTYPPGAFPLSRLRSYGVQGVRSARGLPPALARALEADAKTNA